MIGLSLLMTSVPLVHPYLATTVIPITVWVVILIVVLVSTFWIEAWKLVTLERIRASTEPDTDIRV